MPGRSNVTFLLAATAVTGVLALPSAQQPPAPVPAPTITVPDGAASIEQTTQGTRPAADLVASFEGLGDSFSGPQGKAVLRNPSDNSIAVGPNHIVVTVNTRMAIFPLSQPPPPDPAATATPPQGRAARGGGPGADTPKGPYSMCYAISTGPDPFGPYYRYEFLRPLFPDYPRPAIWRDGYYVPTSTGDDVVQKHACVIDRAAMLKGKPATEQCIVIDGVNFLNNADIDGKKLPDAGAPNIMMATGGMQLKNVLEDDGIYAWAFHVDWKRPERTRVTGPQKISVAPYRYLCGGQLTNCVPQPGTDRRLDAQGDKIMARLVYRRIGNRESIVAVHSVNTSAGGGGVRWYEFTVGEDRRVSLHQQGTYAPGGMFRWMASPAIDRFGNIGIRYSFGGVAEFPGQRFAGRLASDPPWALTLAETILVEGQGAQSIMRWEDYTQTAIDPSDDCTIWYVGDYLTAGATNYSSRIGAFRMPGCGG